MKKKKKIKTDPNELKKNDLMNKLDMEYAHKLAYLGNEIEDQDFKKGDEAEEISDIMSRFKGKVLTFLMDSGYTDKNTLFLSDRKVSDLSQLENILLNKIDYTNTNKIIAMEKENAIQYLEKMSLKKNLDQLNLKLNIA